MSDSPGTPARRGPLPFTLVAAGCVAAAVGLGWVAGKLRTGQVTSSPGGSGTTTGRGQVVFQANCASCHGPEGCGDGPSATSLRPPPRDFAARPWRFKVTRESIRQVTLDGIPGTRMPACRTALAPADVEPLVEYVYGLATARPAVQHEPSPEEGLLKGAGLIDLRGTDAPALRVADAAGRRVSLSDLKGRLVLVNFWGTACVHCLKEMPKLRDLEARLAGRAFTVLSVCADAEADEAQKAADRVAPGMRIFVDETGLGVARFEAQVLPAIWIIGPDGKAVGRSNGARDWSDPAFRRLIEFWLPPGKG